MPNGASSAVSISPTASSERPLIEKTLKDTGLFREEEIAVALEVLDVYLLNVNQQDYQVFSARLDGLFAGYVVFGRNSMTDGVYELYWIAVSPELQKKGVGSALMTYAEDVSRREGGRMMAVETSGRDDYLPTIAFYRRIGYLEAAKVPDYYAIGDPKIIFTRLL